MLTVANRTSTIFKTIVPTVLACGLNRSRKRIVVLMCVFSHTEGESDGSFFHSELSLPNLLGDVFEQAHHGYSQVRHFSLIAFTFDNIRFVVDLKVIISTKNIFCTRITLLYRRR